MDFLGNIRDEIELAIQSGAQGSELADEILLRLCKIIGGGEVYWPRVDRAARNTAIHRDRSMGYSLEEIAKRNGCSRPTVYRVLLKK